MREESGVTSVVINGVEMSPEQVVTLRQAVMAAVDIVTEQANEQERARFLAMLHLLRPQSPEVEHRVGVDGAALPGVRWRPVP